MNKSSFGVIGLGVMGKSLSINIAEKGFSLAVYNRAEGTEAHTVDNFIKENADKGHIQGFTDLKAFADALEKPRKILLMIKAGDTIDLVTNQLLPCLSEEDIIIDGGNSHYLDTKRRYEVLAKKNIHFIGAGISGGEEGALRGPSIMPGGNKNAYAQMAPILEAIAAKDESNRPCCTYIGPEGAGHFIKMVHNGIEYVEMQLLAELYALMSATMDYESIAREFSEWNKSEANSYLLEITIDILQKKEGDQYLLDLILDQAGSKGTGSWSSKTALDLGAANTMMSSAVFARYISSFKKARTELSGLVKKQQPASDTKPTLTQLKNAYHFARLVNHHQGFALMQQASETYNWQLNLSEIARIWTNGCIIKSALMDGLVPIYKEVNNLLSHRATIDRLQANESDITTLLQYGIKNRVPLPSFSAAYQYWVAMTTQNLPANLIQAQRDYFGAHTYQRVDNPVDQFFHTNWR